MVNGIRQECDFEREAKRVQLVNDAHEGPINLFLSKKIQRARVFHINLLLQLEAEAITISNLSKL